MSKTIKKGDRVMVVKPLKVVAVDHGDSLSTVTVGIVFHSIWGTTIKDEIEIPLSYVRKKQKPKEGKKND